MQTNKKGFTLIELLVVVAIIGLLSTLSILSLNTARARARDAKRVADVKQIQTALEMYYNDASNYPVEASVTPTSTGGIYYGASTFLKTVPTPPTTIDGTGCVGSQPAYTYAVSGTGSTATYTIKYCLGAAVNDIPAGLNTATPAGIK